MSYPPPGTNARPPRPACDNGLGNLPVITNGAVYDDSPPYEAVGTTVYAVSAGTRYRAMAGGPSVTVTCSPGVNLRVSDGAVQASVVYSVSVAPVTVDLSGATRDGGGGENILIGQHCAASLGGTVGAVTYQWSVSGPTFQTWSADTPPVGASPYNPDASYYVDGPGDLTLASPGWYWHDLHQTTETVSCTANVTPPAGQGAAFSVTATKQITVWVPDWEATGSGGYVKVNSFAPGSIIELFAGPTAAQVAGGQVSGMEFFATVAPPIGTSLFEAGSLILVQLVTPRFAFSDSNGNFHACRGYGQQGLDTDYPYRWDNSSQPYTAGDSPGFGLVDSVTLSADLTADFETYLMYFAPSSVQAVPVARFIWNTRGDAYIPTTLRWADYAAQHGGSDAAGTVTPSGNLSRFLPYNDFPMWTQINTAGF